MVPQSVLDLHDLDTLFFGRMSLIWVCPVFLHDYVYTGIDFGAEIASDNMSCSGNPQFVPCLVLFFLHFY